MYLVPQLYELGKAAHLIHGDEGLFIESDFTFASMFGQIYCVTLYGPGWLTVCFECVPLWM